MPAVLVWRLILGEPWSFAFWHGLTLPLLLFAFVTIIRFATADGDLTVLSKTAPPRSAYQGKVRNWPHLFTVLVPS